jgi:hypothetical protein
VDFGKARPSRAFLFFARVQAAFNLPSLPRHIGGMTQESRQRIADKQLDRPMFLSRAFCYRLPCEADAAAFRG